MRTAWGAVLVAAALLGTLAASQMAYAFVPVTTTSSTSTTTTIAPSAPAVSINPVTPNLGSVTISGTVSLGQGTTLSTLTVDWGDNSNQGQTNCASTSSSSTTGGTPQTITPGTTFSASHTYCSPGPYYIVVTANAKDTNNMNYVGSSETIVDITQTATSSTSTTPAPATGVYCIANNGAVTQVGNCIADSFPLAILGLMLSMALVAVAYMAGEVIELGGLKGWYKREMWETAKSALLIGIIFSSLVLASGIATTLAGNAATYGSSTQQTAGTSIVSNMDSLYSTAVTSYIQPQLLASYGSFATDLGLAMGAATLGSITISTWVPDVPIYIGSVAFGSDANLYTSGYVNPVATGSGGSFMKNLMTLVIVPVMLVFQFQNDLLPLIVSIGFAVFLPLGIILRAFPFLRPIGGTMIAIAIGTSLVYPALLVGFNLPISNYFTAATGYGAAPAPSTCTASGWSGIFCVFVTGVENFIADLTPGSAILAATLGSSNTYNFASSDSLPLLYNSAYGVGFFDSINSIMPALNLALTTSINEILQFILFIFDIVIGLVIVNGISAALGGIDFSKRRGIGKFKLF